MRGTNNNNPQQQHNNSNNNNNNSRQQQQQRYRKQDDHNRMNDRNAHGMMRRDNRNAHVTQSGQTFMRRGNALHPHMDRSMNPAQAPQTPSITQVNSSSSLLQPLSVGPAQPTNTNTSPLQKAEEV